MNYVLWAGLVISAVLGALFFLYPVKTLKAVVGGIFGGLAFLACYFLIQEFSQVF